MQVVRNLSGNRGSAIEGMGRHTDIIAHSTKYIPTRTGAEFLELLHAAGRSNAAEAVPEFVGRHPETARFLQDSKPSPVSFATEKYFGVNAFRFVKDGRVTMLRYRVVPVAGEARLDAEALKAKSPTYLFDEIPKRLQSGPVEFKLFGQVAEDGDVTDDATVIWPEERANVYLISGQQRRSAQGVDAVKGDSTEVVKTST